MHVLVRTLHLGLDAYCHYVTYMNRCFCCVCVFVLQLEDTCGPIVSKLYAAGGAPGGEAGSDDDLGDHDEL